MVAWRLCTSREDVKHGRDVALKALHPDLSATLGRERFLREIQMAARLSHPHILPLFDSGEAAGVLYYVMPVVRGESLRDRLTRESRIPVQDAVRIAAATAQALAYAHEQGIVHRDVKPENILLQDGHVLVADFGIGKAISAVRRGRNDADRDGGRDARVHEPGTGGRAKPSTDAATSTRSAACSTRCSSASRRSPDRTHRP